MQENENGFFRWIWRFNGIALAIAFVAITVAVTLNLLTNFPRHQERAITNVAKDPEGKEKWKLGYARLVNDAYVVVPLVSEQESVKLPEANLTSGLHKYGNDNGGRNLLFINGQSNISKWLFPTNNQILCQFEFLPTSPTCESKGVRVISYQVVSDDTNGDKKLTAADLVSIAVSKPDGSGYKVLVSKADRVIDMSLLQGDTAILVYQKNHAAYSATYSLSDFSILNEKKLPTIP